MTIRKTQQHHRFTREQDLFILKLRAAGCSFGRIADEFNHRWGTQFFEGSMQTRHKLLEDLGVCIETEEIWLENVVYRGSIALPRLKCLGEHA